MTDKDWGPCDSCGKSAVWHVFGRQAGAGRDAAADVRLSELKLCDRCWEYVQPVVGLFGWVIVSVYYLHSEDLGG